MKFGSVLANVTLAGTGLTLTFTNDASATATLTSVGPVFDATTPIHWLTSTASPTGDSLTVTGSTASNVTVSLTLSPTTASSSGVRVSVTASNPATASSPFSFNTLTDSYTFHGATPLTAFSPAVKLDASDVTSHWQWKSPAVSLDSPASSMFSAVVGNLSSQSADSLKAFPLFLDTHTSTSSGSPPTLIHGVGATKLTFPYLYGLSGDGLSIPPNTSLAYDYVVLLQTTSPSYSAVSTLASFLWSAYGSGALSTSPSLQTNHNTSAGLTTFDSYRSWGWDDAGNASFFSFTCTNGDACGSFSADRLGWASKGSDKTTQDGWYTAQYQTLRTVRGWMYHTGSADTRPQTALSAALSAPQVPNYYFRGGPFPTITWLPANGSQMWAPSSPYEGLCHVYPAFETPEACDQWWDTFSNSMTAYWMVELWSVNGTDTRVLPYLDTYARFLGKSQELTKSKSGVIPAYYIFNDTTFEWIDSPVLGETNAETAMHGLFLYKLYSVTSNPDYLPFAQAALEYVTTDIVPTRKWWTSDLFLGDSPLDVNATDTFTGQPMQSTLGMLAAASMYLTAYQLNSNATLLSMGQDVMAYMSLFQSVVNHPSLSINTLGGMATTNAQSAWNDARTAFAADVFFQYYAETGDPELLERGVAALRASLPATPASAWAETGSDDGPSQSTSFVYGIGSALTSVEFWTDEFGEVFTLLPFHETVCLDGCTSSVTSNSTTISLTIDTEYTFSKGLRCVVETNLPALDSRLHHSLGTTGTGFTRRGQLARAAAEAQAPGSGATALSNDDDDDDTMWQLVVNGHLVGTFSGGELSDGVVVPV